MINPIYLNGEKISGGINYYLSPECYSTEEREVGCWIDGKPLYQKSYYVASPSKNADTKISDNSMLAIEQCVSIEGTYKRIAGGGNNIMTYKLTGKEQTTGSEDSFIRVDMPDGNNKGFTYYLKTDNDVADLIVTIQYTKTADTAGSGVWTPSGIPSVHYSTEEQVIGTWMGETLYQKTYIKNNVGSSNEVVDANMTISNVTIVGIINNGVEMNSPYNGEVFKEYVSSAVVLRVFNSSSGLQCNLEGNHNYTGNVRFTVQYTKSSS